MRGNRGVPAAHPYAAQLRPAVASVDYASASRKYQPPSIWSCGDPPVLCDCARSCDACDRNRRTTPTVTSIEESGSTSRESQLK